MNDRRWTRWVAQTARTWEDISTIVRMTGVAAVDADHRKLAEYVLSLNTVVEEMRGQDVSLERIRAHAELLRELYAYSAAHFKREEDLIEKYGLPGLEDQQKQHQELLGKLAEVLRAFDAGRIAVTSELKLAALDWVVGHINDFDYATFRMESWSGVLSRATQWEEMEDAVRKTNVSFIDDDHVALTRMILDILRDAGAGGAAGKGRLAGRLSALSKFAGEHFDREEKVLSDFTLPERESHAALHREFLRLLGDLEGRAARSSLPSHDECRRLLLSWWVNHINDVDLRSLSIGVWANRLFERCSTWQEVEGLIRKTGIPEVDEDHRLLVETGLKLSDLLRPGVYGRREAFEESVRVVAKMRDIALEHFAREEVIMRDRKLPLEARHRAEHEKLRATLGSMSADIASGRIRASQDIKARILAWWLDHTNGMDYETFVLNAEPVPTEAEP